MSLNDIVDRYEHDGFLIIPDLIDAEECHRFKIEAQNVLKEKAHPDASVYVHASVASPLYRQFHKDPRLLNIFKKIMPNGVMFLSDKIVVKTADKTFATPWHIDCFYWPNTRPKLSVWIPFDDANSDNGTLTVVRVADNEINDNDVVTCTVKRGTGIFFSDRLVHGSTSNIARTDRYTVINTYHAPADDEPFDLDFPARQVLVPAS